MSKKTITKFAFSTLHGDSVIEVFAHENKGYSIVFDGYAQKPYPHKKIHSYCFGETVPEMAFALAQWLDYDVKVEPVKDEHKGLEADLRFASIAGRDKVFIPHFYVKIILKALNEIKTK